MKNRPTLRQMEHVLAVLDAKSFSKAAQKLGLSQPALSMSVKNLEENLGLPLFERAQKNLTLTPFGRETADRMRAVLTAVDALTANATAALGAGELALAAIPTLAPFLFPALVPALRAHHPGLDLALAEHVTDDLLAHLTDGTVDLGLLALPAGHGFTAVPLFQESFLLAVPPAHRLANHNTVSADAIPRDELMLLSEGHCLRSQVLALCGHGRRGTSATGLPTLLTMVQAGLGVAVVPASAAESARHLGLVLIPVEGASRDIGMVWRPNDPRARLYKKMAALFKDMFERRFGGVPLA